MSHRQRSWRGVSLLGRLWSRRSSGRTRRQPPRFEVLEQRRILSINVTNANPYGAGSFLDAISQANANPGADTIVFNLDPNSVHVITIDASHLFPAITEQVAIDARLAGSTVDYPQVVLDGASAGSGVDGLVVEADYCSIQGLAIGNFSGAGIRLASNGNWVAGNHLGTNATGDEAAPNEWGLVIDNSAQNMVGASSSPDDGNLISANLSGGVLITGNDASGNTVQRSYIGTTADGTAGLGQQPEGIVITAGATFNLVGIFYDDTDRSRGNVIAGNLANGIRVSDVAENTGDPTYNNWVCGNWIGTDPTGLASVPTDEETPSRQHHGIVIEAEVAGTVVGMFWNSENTELGNLVSGNLDHGIVLDGAGNYNAICGNWIGVDATGEAALANGGAGIYAEDTSGPIIGSYNSDPEGNAAQGNVISGNLGPGIHLHGTTGYASVAGNFIGTDPTGELAVGNSGFGVVVDGGSQGVGIGLLHNPEAEQVYEFQRNVISGNALGGVRFADEGTQGIASGNLIGTNAAGDRALANQGPGVSVGAATSDVTLGLTYWGIVDETFANLISGNDGPGVLVESVSSGSISIVGNKIGTDLTGNTATGTDSLPLGNSGDGIRITGIEDGDEVSGGSQLVHIGLPHNPGTSNAAFGNLISGNLGHGVNFRGPDTQLNLIAGNKIGTNLAGDRALGNQGSGVNFEAGAHHNLVGIVATDSGEPGMDFIDPLEANLISGNQGDGITIAGADVHHMFVAGNIIGLDAAGATATGSDDEPLGNAQSGVAILDGAHHNGIGTVAIELPVLEFDIGTIDPAQRNTISGNLGSGVRIAGAGSERNTVAGNNIGTDVTSLAGADVNDAPLGNHVAGVKLEDQATNNRIGNDLVGSHAIGDIFNVISANLGPGIWLSDTRGGVQSANMDDNNLNVVASNGIGLNVNEEPLGNLGDGILIDGWSTTFVGGLDGDAVNIIAFNGSDNLDDDDQPVGAGVHLRGSVPSEAPTFVNAIVGRNIIGLTVDEMESGIGARTTDPGSFQTIGVLVDEGSQRNIIGTLFGDVRLTVGEQDYELSPNLIGGQSGSGVVLRDTSGLSDNIIVDVVGGNWIGVSFDGLAVGNGGSGIVLDNAQSAIINGNTIGDNGAAGVYITGGSQGNSLANNRIGVFGTVPMPNDGPGILIDDGTQNQIVQTDETAGNVIAANHGPGIHLTGAATSENLVAGNQIGTDAAGILDLGNDGPGVLIDGGATQNIVGVVPPELEPIGAPLVPNTIAFNVGPGVRVTGATTLGNAILGNSIFANDGASSPSLGIDLNLDSAGNEGNQIEPEPVVDGAALAVDGLGDPTGSLRVEYHVPAGSGGIPDPSVPVRVEFFLASADGQGKTFLAADTYGVDELPGFALGDSVVRVLALPEGITLELGDTIVATATDDDGDTSQFSATWELDDTYQTLVTSGEIVLDDAPDLAGIEAVLAALPDELEPLAHWEIVSVEGGDVYTSVLDLSGEYLIHTGRILVLGHARLETNSTILDHRRDGAIMDLTAPQFLVDDEGAWNSLRTSYREESPISLSGGAEVSWLRTTVVHLAQEGRISNPLTLADTAALNITRSTVSEANRVVLDDDSRLNLDESAFTQLEFQEAPQAFDGWLGNLTDGLFVNGTSQVLMEHSHFVTNMDVVLQDSSEFRVLDETLFEQHASSPSSRWFTAYYNSYVEFNEATVVVDVWISWQISGTTVWKYLNSDLSHSEAWHNLGGNSQLFVDGSRFWGTFGAYAEADIRNSPDVFLEYTWDRGVVVDELLPKHVGVGETYEFPDLVPTADDGVDVGVTYHVTVTNSTMTFWGIGVHPGDQVTIRGVPDDPDPAEVGFSVINNDPWRISAIQGLDYTSDQISGTWVVGDREPATLKLEDVRTFGVSMPAGPNGMSIMKHNGQQDVQWANGDAVHEFVDPTRSGLLVAFSNVTSFLTNDVSQAGGAYLNDDARATQNGTLLATGASLSGSVFADSADTANPADYGKVSVSGGTITGSVVVSQRGRVDVRGSEIVQSVTATGGSGSSTDTSRVTVSDSPIGGGVSAVDRAMVFLYGSTHLGTNTTGVGQVLEDDNSDFHYDGLIDPVIPTDLVLDSAAFPAADWIQDLYATQVQGDLTLAGEMHFYADDRPQGPGRDSASSSQVEGDVTLTDFSYAELYRTQIDGGLELADDARAYLEQAEVDAGLTIYGNSLVRLANTVLGTASTAADLTLHGSSRAVVQDADLPGHSQLYGDLVVDDFARIELFDMVIGAGPGLGPSGAGDVLVAGRARAILHNTEIWGDLVVDGDALVYVDNTTIHGQIIVQGNGAVTLDGGVYDSGGEEIRSVLAGGVTTSDEALAFVGEVEIGGDLAVGGHSEFRAAGAVAAVAAAVDAQVSGHGRFEVDHANDLLTNLAVSDFGLARVEDSGLAGDLTASDDAALYFLGTLGSTSIAGNVAVGDRVWATVADVSIEGQVDAAADAVVRLFDSPATGGIHTSGAAVVTPITSSGTVALIDADGTDVVDATGYRVLGDVLVRDTAQVDLSQAQVFGRVIVWGQGQVTAVDANFRGSVTAQDEGQFAASGSVVDGYLWTTDTGALAVDEGIVWGGTVANWGDPEGGGTISLVADRVAHSLILDGERDLILQGGMLYGDLSVHDRVQASNLYSAPGDEVYVLGNLLVPSSYYPDVARIVLSHAVIDGSVDVNWSGQIELSESSVAGTVKAFGYSRLILDQVALGGDLRAEVGAHVEVTDSTVAGDVVGLEFSSVTLTGVVVAGNLTATRYTLVDGSDLTIGGSVTSADHATVTIADSTVTGDLTADLWGLIYFISSTYGGTINETNGGDVSIL